MNTRLTVQEQAFRRVSEKELQGRVIAFARLYGWRVAHFHDSRRQVKPGVFVGDVDAKGFPDLVLVHPRFGFACLELKKELGKVSFEQAAWLDDLTKAGVLALVVRPSCEVVVCGWLSRGFPPVGVVEQMMR
jgi:hypothetical protein